jgi:hypothetical protein
MIPMIPALLVGKPSSAATTHRYWRILVTDNVGSTEYVDADKFVGAARVGFRTAAGGADDNSGTGTADSFYAAGYEPANCFDGNPATRWATSATALPHWVRRDYGAGNEKSIVEVVWQSENSLLAAQTQVPKDFSVQYSDNGSSWTTLWSVTGQTAYTANETRVFTKP